MATIENFTKGLEILKKYELDDSYLGAEHDIIYISNTKNPVSEEDRKALNKLGNPN